MSKGHVQWDHRARVFPSPSGSRPARSLIYAHGEDLYKATIGRPRRRYRRAKVSGSCAAHPAEGQESGSTVIAIVVTDRLIEVWSAEPAGAWANPSLVPHGAVTNIQYLTERG